MTQATPHLVQVRGLGKHFVLPRPGPFGRRPPPLRAVDDVSFDIEAGQTLGLVGESGSGKSTVARLMLSLIPPTTGSVRFEGHDLARLDAAALRPLRRGMQMIFQDPYGALDPRMTVARIVSEPLVIHGERRPEVLNGRALELLNLVGLRAEHLSRHPHEFSGGQRQRIGIARALALQPKLIVCDEPVSALDVSVQAQVVNLLQDLQQRFGIAYLFISHDLAVVRHIAHRVAVMYLGRLVEFADKGALYREPLHPYTRALIASVPSPRPSRGPRAIPVAGDGGAIARPERGCVFQNRCPLVEDVCRHESPPLRGVGSGRLVACHLVAGDAGAVP
jgi:oligopeptide transport system ATP-binding protein